MIRAKGTWRARVEQSFEVEVEHESEIQAAIENGEMNPRNVVELLDFEYEIEETEED